VDQPSRTPVAAPPEANDSRPAGADGHAGPPGFRARGQVRRRARFLRKARELAYRDLGGLVFNLHRFGQRNDALVIAKLSTVSHIDNELRTLETALKQRQPVTVLREAGVTACPRCAAIHSGEDHFCPNCGLSVSRHVDLPIASAPTPAGAVATAASAGAASAPDPAPAPRAAATPAAAAPSTASPGGTPDASGGSSAARPAPAPAPAAAPARAPDPAPAAPPAAASPAAADQEEPTEILRPPTSGA
jgi:hypothetical protein